MDLVGLGGQQIERLIDRLDDQAETIRRLTARVEALESQPTATLEMTVPARRTGVIVGLPVTVTDQAARRIRETLTKRYPHVQFTTISGSQSVAFEWDEPTP